MNRLEIDDGGTGRSSERLLRLRAGDDSSRGGDPASSAAGEIDAVGGGRRGDPASLIDDFVDDDDTARRQIRLESASDPDEDDGAGMLTIGVRPSTDALATGAANLQPIGRNSRRCENLPLVRQRGQKNRIGCRDPRFRHRHAERLPAPRSFVPNGDLVHLVDRGDVGNLSARRRNAEGCN